MTALSLGLLLLGVFVISTIMVLIFVFLGVRGGYRTGKWSYGYLTIPILFSVILSNVGWWGGWICLIVALLQYLGVL